MGRVHPCSQSHKHSHASKRICSPTTSCRGSCSSCSCSAWSHGTDGRHSWWSCCRLSSWSRGGCRSQQSFSGGGESKPAPAPPAPPPSSAPQEISGPCASQIKEFIECSQTQSDLTL